MEIEHIAAAHAETPTCNAGADQPFTCHSLKCRTKAVELDLRSPPVASRFGAPLALVARTARLTLLKGGV